MNTLIILITIIISLIGLFISIQTIIETKKRYSKESILNSRLEEILKEGKMDLVLTKFRERIEVMTTATKNATTKIEATKKYSEELSIAASTLESLTSLYKVQMESSERQEEANKAIIENARKLREHMESLSGNLSSLGGVYSIDLNKKMTNDD